MSAPFFPAKTATWERADTPVLASAARQIETIQTSIGPALAAFKLRENLDMGEGAHAPLAGPMPDRGPATGLVLRGGRIAASWGTPARCDIAFSVTKGCLGLLAGMAVEEGLIPAMDAPVSASVAAAEFQGANAAVTWRQLMTLTSEWQGVLHGIPDRSTFTAMCPNAPTTRQRARRATARRPETIGNSTMCG